MLNNLKYIKLFSPGFLLGIKPVFYIIFYIVFVFSTRAQQNLVPNGSFEEYDTCPLMMDDFSVSNWISPSTGSPNYLNSCNNTDVSVPQNSWGYQYARTGNAYVGITISDLEPTSTNAREYIQAQLISPLEKDELYEISFYVSRADSSRRACDNIGLYLSENAISGWNNLNLSYNPQVVSEVNYPITNDTSWIQISKIIKAIGGEKFITLGIFSDNINTNWINVDGSTNSDWQFEIYYYIDDVSIVKLNNIPNVFTPNGDGTNDFIDFSFSSYEIEIYNRWGIKVYSTNEQGKYWYGKDVLGNQLSQGVYFYRTENNKTGFIHLIR